jgi:hypothetical protein
MANRVVRNLVDLRNAGWYLPSLLLFYLYFETGWWGHLSLSITALLGAMVMHGLLRSVFGPGGPQENPLREEEGSRRMASILLGGSQPMYLAKKRTDFALNGPEYWILMGRIRQFGLLLSIALVLTWPVATLFALVGVFSYLPSARFTIIVVYFALGVWLIQEFLLWPRFPSVYLYEEESNFSYVTKYEVIDLDEANYSPYRPAKWMKPADAQLLQILAEKGILCSPRLIAYYYAQVKSEESGVLGVIRTIDTMFTIEDDVAERLNEMSEYELVHRYDPGLYQITDAGEAYVAGQLDAAKLETGEET